MFWVYEADGGDGVRRSSRVSRRRLRRRPLEALARELMDYRLQFDEAKYALVWS